MLPGLVPQEEMQKYNLSENQYIIVTIHRDFNTDDLPRLAAILKGLNQIAIQTGVKVLFPMHPRVRKKVQEFGLQLFLENLTITEPLGYMELIALLQHARYAVTDSGGFQREAYWAQKRALLIMPQGWQELTDTGWHLLENSPQTMDWEAKASDIAKSIEYPGEIFGDGFAAQKIVDIILKR